MPTVPLPATGFEARRRAVSLRVDHEAKILRDDLPPLLRAVGRILAQVMQVHSGCALNRQPCVGEFFSIALGVPVASSLSTTSQRKANSHSPHLRSRLGHSKKCKPTSASRRAQLQGISLPLDAKHAATARSLVPLMERYRRRDEPCQRNQPRFAGLVLRDASSADEFKRAIE